MTPEEVIMKTFGAVKVTELCKGESDDYIRGFLGARAVFMTHVPGAALTALSAAGFVVVEKGFGEKLLQDVEEQILHEKDGLTAEQIARFPPNYCDGYDEGLGVAISVVDDVRKAMQKEPK